MIGIFLAAVFGGLQFYLLLLTVRAAAGGRLHVAALVAQFLCPMAGLLLCALLAPAQLLRCAVGLCIILIGGALIFFVKSRRQQQEKKG